jgi:hypothetical protein
LCRWNASSASLWLAPSVSIRFILVVFFIAGKKLQQPGFEQFIRLERLKEKFPAPRA